MRHSLSSPATSSRIGRCMILMVCCLAATGALHAHGPGSERVLIPLPRGEGRPDFLLPLLLPGHLVLPAVDFGSIAAGEPASRIVRVENVTESDLTVTVDPSAHASAVPSSFTLGPAGSATAGRDVEVVFSSGQAGDFVGEQLGFTVTHAGIADPRLETMSVSAQVKDPSPLLLMVGGQPLSAGNTFEFGLVRLESYPFIDPPEFELSITNQGELPVFGLTLDHGGTGFPDHVSPVGACSGTDPRTLFCVARSDGSPGDSLGTLPPGATVTTTWRLLTWQTGALQASFTVSGAQAQTTSFSLEGEITPFSTLGEDFLTAELVSRMLDDPATLYQMALTKDAGGEDRLGTLRVTSFDANTVFSVGELDAVDLRTGNLTFIAPIGGPQEVRGPLAYELQAVLNSGVWQRVSTGEYNFGNDQKPKIRGLSAEYPNPLFNLGWGASLHLGRLFEPRNFDGAEPVCGPGGPVDPLAFEDQPNLIPRYLYVDPSGTRHELWLNLHSGEPTTGGGAYESANVLYARDGSYLRMVRESATKRWVEEPGGIRRLFEKQSAPQPTLPDLWLLTEIRDLYGNAVRITYGDVTIDGQTLPGWTIADGMGDSGDPWREVKVGFRDWTGRSSDQPMIVDRIELPGFRAGEQGGDPARIYRFEYTDLTLGRPSRSTFHGVFADRCAQRQPPVSVDVNVTRPRLDAIVQPDDSRYAFGYETVPIENDLLLTSIGLPSGGTLSYAYKEYWDSPPDCRANAKLEKTPGVWERTASDASGRLARKRFFRQVRSTSDVPANICNKHEPTNHSTIEPWSEQAVVIWTEQELAAGGRTGLSTASAHYFNIYPFNDTCRQGMEGCVNRGTAEAPDWRLASGRSNIERNLKIRRSETDGDLFLSSREYECPMDLDGGPAIAWDRLPGVRDPEPDVDKAAGDRVSDLLSACTVKEEQWSRYEVSRAANSCGLFSPRCLLDSRVKSTKTVYHDDFFNNPTTLRWVRVDRDDFDGLGHFRATTTSTNFEQRAGEVVQRTFQNFHPEARTLTLNPDHTIATNITPPSVWSLGHYEERWTEEGGVYRGGEAHFHPTLGHLSFERTWESTNCDPNAGLVGCRGVKDLVVRNVVNAATGELDFRRFFGADTFAGMPTDDAWFDASGWGAANADYTVGFLYRFGVLSEQRVDGATVYEVRRAIDQATGWPKTETLNSGEVLTFDYDGMGRIEWLTSPVTASRRFEYDQDATDSLWQLTETVYAAGTTAETASPSAIRKYAARYDGLGRLRQEDLPKYDDNPDNAANRRIVTRTLDYHPSGQVFKVSPLDAPGGTPVRSWYDFRGRLLDRHFPDGSKTANLYGGVRASTSVACVKTPTPDGGTGSGICPGSLQKADTVVKRDFRGRVVEVLRPEGEVTTFRYDPLGNRTQAKRSSQTRSWSYNGIGFMTGETIPERSSAIDFSDFNTRGQARLVTEVGRTTYAAYDAVGRLRRIGLERDTLPLKTFTYGDTGSENGQLTLAERFNYRDATTGGGDAAGNAGAWRVASTLGYDAAGRRASRATAVTWEIDGSLPPDGGTTTFTQGWSYDDLANPRTLTYPNCVNRRQTQPGTFEETPCGAGRVVDMTYDQGFYLTQVTEEGLGASLTYHASGLVHEVVHDGGSTDRYSVANGMPRPSAIDLAVGSGNRLDLGSVGYDWSGNVTSVGTESFLYDRNTRLVSATVRGSATPFTYDYDDFDNPIGKGTVDPTTNQLTGVGWVYDRFGNLIQGSEGGGNTVSLIYDDLDKLITLDRSSGDSQYSLYDHDDLRILRWTAPSGEVTWTLRDGLRVIREFTGLNPAIAVARDYIYAGSRRLASEEYPGGTVRHYHEDLIGSTRVVSGAPAVRRHVHYEPFGLTLAGSGEPTVGFGGHEDDGLTTYMRGRSYLPLAARFLQVDPGRDEATWSLYAYAANDPLSNVDVTGLEPEKTHDEKFETGIKLFRQEDAEGSVGLVEISLLNVGLKAGPFSVGIGVTELGEVTTPGSQIFGRSPDVNVVEGRATVEASVSFNGVGPKIQVSDRSVRSVDKKTDELRGSFSDTSFKSEITTKPSASKKVGRTAVGAKTGKDRKFFTVKIFVFTINIPLEKKPVQDKKPAE